MIDPNEPLAYTLVVRKEGDTSLSLIDTESVDARRLARPLSVSLAAISMLAIVPLAIIARANPDWHLVSCLITAIACMLTLLAFDTYGGKSFRLQFAIPFLIMFAATPWPYAMETALVDLLKTVNAAVTLEILNRQIETWRKESALGLCDSKYAVSRRKITYDIFADPF